MIKEAQNKAIRNSPSSKEGETSLKEWYFSADGDRPPVTIIAANFEDAVEQYNKKFNITQP